MDNEKRNELNKYLRKCTDTDNSFLVSLKSHLKSSKNYMTIGNKSNLKILSDRQYEVLEGIINS